MGVGLMGSMRFGLYENFKSKMAQIKGLSNAGQLERADKSLCALFAGVFVSFLVVIVSFYLVSC